MKGFLSLFDLPPAPPSLLLDAGNYLIRLKGSSHALPFDNKVVANQFEEDTFFMLLLVGALLPHPIMSWCL